MVWKTPRDEASPEGDFVLRPEPVFEAALQKLAASPFCSPFTSDAAVLMSRRPCGVFCPLPGVALGMPCPLLPA